MLHGDPWQADKIMAGLVKQYDRMIMTHSLNVLLHLSLMIMTDIMTQ